MRIGIELIEVSILCSFDNKVLSYDKIVFDAFFYCTYFCYVEFCKYLYHDYI